MWNHVSSKQFCGFCGKYSEYHKPPLLNCPEEWLCLQLCSLHITLNETSLQIRSAFISTTRQPVKVSHVWFFLRMTIIYMWMGTKNGFMGKERWLKCVKMQFSTASHITELKYTTLLTNCTLNCHHKGQGFYSSHFFVCFRNTFGLSLCLLETEMHKSRLL